MILRGFSIDCILDCILQLIHRIVTQKTKNGQSQE